MKIVSFLQNLGTALRFPKKHGARCAPYRILRCSGPRVGCALRTMKEVGILQSVFKTAALSQDKRRILQDPLVSVPNFLATKVRARAERSQGIRPNLRGGRPANFLKWSTSRMLVNCSSFSVKGRSPHSSRRGKRYRCKVPINHDTLSLSFIGSSNDAVLLTNSP